MGGARAPKGPDNVPLVLNADRETGTSWAAGDAGAYCKSSIVAGVRAATVVTTTVFEFLTTLVGAGPSVYVAAAVFEITVPAGAAKELWGNERRIRAIEITINIVCVLIRF